VPVPESVQGILNNPKQSTLMKADYEQLKQYLLK